MYKVVFKCNLCNRLWLEHQLCDEKCPYCQGKVKDATDTRRGTLFLETRNSELVEVA